MTVVFVSVEGLFVVASKNIKIFNDTALSLKPVLKKLLFQGCMHKTHTKSSSVLIKLQTKRA